MDYKVDDYIHSQMDGKYFDLDKIPLTDELILEFGFKKNESDGVVEKRTYLIPLPILQIIKS